MYKKPSEYKQYLPQIRVKRTNNATMQAESEHLCNY